MFKIHRLIMILTFIILMCNPGFSQEPYRVGTTSAGFLEIGVGGAGIAMGDAFVASTGDMSSIYWNPAGLALLKNNEALFMYQPWVADINSLFVGFALPLPRIGTIALGISGLDYGSIDVTTLEYQQGTGEQYTAYDYNFYLTFSRSIVDWFSFGATLKYITSNIWHSSANAMAADLGVLIQTPFFSPNGKEKNGLRIGMSIANYGTQLRYDGDDLLFPVDINEAAHGNYQNLQGKYKMSDWELPLIFRVGVAATAIALPNQKLTIEADALHPNNAGESVNIGAEYKFFAPGFGDFSLRGGYKGLFLIKSQFGPTFGAGLNFYLSPTLSVNIDYAYRTLGVLGDIHCSSFGVRF
jgi:hypothetical protein